ncbi:hypothetical protein TDB9533_04058 [Thalassocella blandensis]|nr:hypothetical protein TDB9533_04058 [Thalassocella blandensis]
MRNELSLFMAWYHGGSGLSGDLSPAISVTAECVAQRCV